MMSIVKRFRKCADLFQRYLTSDDAHDLHCVFGRRARELCSRGNRVPSL